MEKGKVIMRPLCRAVAAVLIVSVHIPRVDAQPVPPAQAALQVAQQKAKTAPLGEAATAYLGVVQRFPGTDHAAQALAALGNLYNTNKVYDKALECGEAFLATFPDSPHIGKAIRVKCTALLNRPGGDRSEVLAFLDEVVPQYEERLTAQDHRWFAVYRAEAYRQLKDPEAAAEAFRAGLVQTPGLLDLYDGRYLNQYIENLVRARKPHDAVRMAKGGYACCRFNEEAIKDAANAAVRALMGSGAIHGAQQFLEAQEDPEAENPLTDTKWPELTDEEKQQMLAACGDDQHMQVVVLLFTGDVEQAFGIATARLTDAEKPDEIGRCIDDIARCFKAKDLNLVRANAFIKYAKEGEGENPLPDF